ADLGWVERMPLVAVAADVPQFRVPGRAGSVMLSQRGPAEVLGTLAAMSATATVVEEWLGVSGLRVASDTPEDCVTASVILAALRAWGRAQGARRVWMFVAEKDSATMTWALKCGFQRHH